MILKIFQIVWNSLHYILLFHSVNPTGISLIQIYTDLCILRNSVLSVNLISRPVKGSAAISQYHVRIENMLLPASANQPKFFLHSVERYQELHQSCFESQVYSKDKAHCFEVSSLHADCVEKNCADQVQRHLGAKCGHLHKAFRWRQGCSPKEEGLWVVTKHSIWFSVILLYARECEIIWPLRRIITVDF